MAGSIREDDPVLVAMKAEGAPKQFGLAGLALPGLLHFAGANGDSVLDFGQLQSPAGDLAARRIVLLVDICHAGGVARTMPGAAVNSRGVSVRSGTVSPESALVVRAVQAGSRMANRDFAVLAEARPDELSLESEPNGGLLNSTWMRGLAAARGRQTLETLFRDQVLQPVAPASPQICAHSRGRQVQTPVFADSGRGNLIQVRATGTQMQCHERRWQALAIEPVERGMIARRRSIPRATGSHRHGVKSCLAGRRPKAEA